jgi:hypothetical protein
MKKGKKFLAAILTAATVFSMGIMPVFADGEAASDESSKPITELTFSKEFASKETDGTLPNASFEFTMTPSVPVDSDGKTITTYNGLDVVQGLALDTATKKIDFTATAESDVKKTESFSLTLKDGGSFTGPKAYSYQVKEVIPADNKKDDSIEYDDTIYTVFLLVDNNNKVTAAVNVSSAKPNTDGTSTTTSIDKNVGKKPIEFKNTCSTDSLTIKKEVTGSMGSKTEQFKFQIVIPVEGAATGHTIEKGTKYTGTIYRKSTGTADADPVEITVCNESDLAKDQNTFYLADGDYLTIKGLPESTIYTVKELDATDYHTSIKGTFSSGNTEVIKNIKYEDFADDKKEESKIYDASEAGNNTPLVNGGNTILFTNKKDVTPTGLVVAFGPQILVLLIALGGALVIFKTRRKAER